jgi:hypothetical protein
VLAAELEKHGYKVSLQKVGELLKSQGYSLQAVAKSLEGESHPDRNAQFEHINAQVQDFQVRGQPVISVDIKKKELVEEFKNAGREWQPKGAPVLSLTHDFLDTAMGKAIPYGVYDIGGNSAWVSVGGGPRHARLRRQQHCHLVAEDGPGALSRGEGTAGDSRLGR